MLFNFRWSTSIPINSQLWYYTPPKWQREPLVTCVSILFVLFLKMFIYGSAFSCLTSLMSQKLSLLWLWLSLSDNILNSPLMVIPARVAFYCGFTEAEGICSQTKWLVCDCRAFAIQSSNSVWKECWVKTSDKLPLWDIVLTGLKIVYFLSLWVCLWCMR